MKSYYQEKLDRSEQELYDWVLNATIEDLDTLAKYVINSEINWVAALGGIHGIEFHGV